MKLLFDESLSPRLVELLRDLFPESESSLRKGLAGGGDLRILEYASAGNFILVVDRQRFRRSIDPAPWRQRRHSPFVQLSN
jgi:predicted nuclease of predicted toxin-antitoxin system